MTPEQDAETEPQPEERPSKKRTDPALQRALVKVGVAVLVLYGVIDTASNWLEARRAESREFEALAEQTALVGLPPSIDAGLLERAATAARDYRFSGLDNGAAERALGDAKPSFDAAVRDLIAARDRYDEAMTVPGQGHIDESVRQAERYAEHAAEEASRMEERLGRYPERSLIVRRRLGSDAQTGHPTYAALDLGGAREVVVVADAPPAYNVPTRFHVEDRGEEEYVVTRTNAFGPFEMREWVTTLVIYGTPEGTAELHRMAAQIARDAATMRSQAREMANRNRTPWLRDGTDALRRMASAYGQH